MMAQRRDLYGLMAEFREADELLHAARGVCEAGYTRVETYSPFPIEEMAEALDLPKSPVAIVVLFGATLGAGAMYALMWYSAVIDYPWNIGGRPLHSWPSFIPLTFELAVLVASVLGLAAMLFLNRFPMPYHPVSNVPRFRRASVNRFFLCIEAADPKFDPERTSVYLQQFNPLRIDEVAR